MTDTSSITGSGGNQKKVYGGGASGVVYSIDLVTGVTLWTWDTTSDNLWGNFRVNSGGGLWYPPSVDENGILYLSVGNPGPWPGTEDFPNGSSQPGPNDYANCLVPLDPEGGTILWYQNVKPHDLFDHDNQNSPILTEADIDDTSVKIVIASGKHGYVVAFDRGTGKQLWRTAVGEHMNDDVLEIPDEGQLTMPGFGAGITAPIACSNGRVFAATLNAATYFIPTGIDDNRVEHPSVTSDVVALDVATGAILWSVRLKTNIAGPGDRRRDR